MTGIALLAGSGTLHARAYGVSRTTAAVRGPNGNVAVVSRTAVVRPLPRGYVRVVPTGYRSVYYGGYNCYYVGNVYYRAAFYEGETVYIVVH